MHPLQVCKPRHLAADCNVLQGWAVGTQQQCATIKSGFPQQPSSRSNQIENLSYRTGIPPGDEEGGETGDGCRDDHDDGPNLDDDRVLLLTRLPSCDQSWRFPTW